METPFKILSKTGRGRGAHYHIVYLNEETGQAITSVDHNHQHDVLFHPPVMPPPPPPEIGEDGMPLPPQESETPPEPLEPAWWEVMPGEDGHTHELDDYEAKTNLLEKETDSEVVSDVIELYKECTSLEAESFKKAKDADDFFAGNQWDLTEKENLAAIDRAAITLNKTARHVNELSGVQRQERTDITYVPTEGGDQAVCDVLNVLAKVTLNGCNYASEESEFFLDAAICGRGNVTMRVDFDEALTGKIIVERFPWDRINYGPHEKFDASDAEYLIKQQLYSKAKLRQLYPDKADEISADFDYYTEINKDSPHVSTGHDEYNRSPYRSPATIGSDVLVDVARKEYKVLECWRKVYQKIPIVVNQVEGVYFNALGWSKGDLDRIKELSPDFFIVNRTVVKMRISKIAGSLLLSDEYPANLPVDDFFDIPVYAQRRNGKFWGVVENSKDPQKLINKLYSLCVDIANKTSSWGWFYDQSTFPSAEDKDHFRKTGNSPGFMVELSDASRLPAKVEGTKFPAELVNLMQVADAAVMESMNIMVESAGANESASKLMHRQKARLTGNEYLFDHLTLTKRVIGKRLIPLFRRYYTPEDVARIVLSKAGKESISIDGTPAQDYSVEAIAEIFSTADLEKVDVEVTETSSSPTHRIAIFMLLKELAEAGIAIPPQLLIETAEIPDTLRTKALDGLAQQEAAAADAGSQTQDMEITKTLIAQGIIPPKVAEQYQIQNVAGPQELPPTGAVPQEGIAEY